MRAADTATGLLDEVRGQQVDVTSAAAQGRQAHRHDGEAVEELGAEGPGACLGLHVRVGRCHDADASRTSRIDPGGPRQPRQELLLDVQRQGLDPIEEEGAAIGLSQGAGLGRSGARRRAQATRLPCRRVREPDLRSRASSADAKGDDRRALEQDGGHLARVHGGAVDADEGCLVAWTERVQDVGCRGSSPNCSAFNVLSM